MANERKHYKSNLRLLKKIAAAAEISKKVNELREALEECISAGEQPGDGIIDDDLRYLAKTVV
jgi:tRNA isopentenyl-2-thiomethyl-A-37 hydroxylase MiaE